MIDLQTPLKPTVWFGAILSRMMTESAALISAVNRWISTVNQFQIPADSALKAENDPEQDASGVSEISGGGG